MNRRWASVVQVDRVSVSKAPHVRCDVRLIHFFVFTFIDGTVKALNSTKRLVLIRDTNMDLNVMLGAVLAELSSSDAAVNVEVLESVSTGGVGLVNTGQIGKSTLSRFGKKSKRTASAKVKRIESMGVAAESFDTRR
jgi:hypothetical protein